MSPDPENAGASLGAPQSWNAYSYVLNNPLNAVDPFGLDCVYAAIASDNPYRHNDGTPTIVPGDCYNINGNDSGVFVDNAENHPVQSSDVTLSDDGSVGIIAYTRTDGLTTGYACMGNCPSDSIKVSDTPTMSAETRPLSPFQILLLPPPPQKPITTLELRQIQVCMSFGGAENVGYTNPGETPQDFSHPTEVIGPQTKATYVKVKEEGKPLRPGRVPLGNRNGAQSGRALTAAAGGFGLLGDVSSCINSIRP
jgi:hypothetical protein